MAGPSSFKVDNAVITPSLEELASSVSYPSFKVASKIDTEAVGSSSSEDPPSFADYPSSKVDKSVAESSDMIHP